MLLNTPYPNRETREEIFITSLASGLLFYLFLITYQPFGASDYQHTYKYLMLSPYAFTVLISFLIVGLSLPKLTKSWTIGLELARIFIILLISAVLSFLYNSLFWDGGYLNFKNLFNQFIYNSALGIPVSAIYLMARYIYFERKKELMLRSSLNGRNDRHDNLALNSLNPTLHIVADYEDFELKIKGDDFIYAEAADNYCIISYSKNNEIQKRMIRISLKRLLSQIHTDTIKKIHRSSIVNLSKVSDYKGNSTGYKISIPEIGKELNISRNYIDATIPVLKNLAACP